MAAPVFVAKSTASSGTGASQTVNYMGSILAGDDLFIAALSYQEPGGSIGDITLEASAIADGWQEVGGGIAFRDSVPNDVGTFKVFRKIADGTETGSVQLDRSGSNGGSNAFFIQMYQYRGQRTVLADSETNIVGDGNTTITWNGITPAGSEAIAIAFIGQLTNGPGTPAGYVNDASDFSGGVVLYLEVHSDATPTSGNKTASGGDPDGWATVHLLLFNAIGRNQIIN